MRATGSTSTKRGPDDPADGLHPVLHVTLGAGHEQERLRVGRHLLPLPGTTCKTGRHRLTAGTPGQIPGALPNSTLFSPGTGSFLSTWAARKPSLQHLSATATLWVLILQPVPHTSLICLWGTFRFLFSPLVLFFHINLKSLKSS